MKELNVYRICLWLLVVLIWITVLCGCKKEQPLIEWHWDVIIKEKRAEGYCISTITMKKIDLIHEPNYPNHINIEDDDSFIIEGCTFVIDPNSASYKAFFGWE